MLWEFFRRALWAIFGVPMLLLLGYLGGWWFFTPMALLCLVGLAEYYSATMIADYRPAVPLGFAAGVAVMVGPQFIAPQDIGEYTAAVVVLAVAGIFLLSLRNGSKKHAVVNTAVTVFGIVYIALFFSYIIHLRNFDLPAAMGDGTIGEFWHRMGAMMLVIVPVWFCDTFAFLVGNTWGKHQLAPRVSPKKTVEGAIAGGLAALLATFSLGLWMGMPWYHAVITGVLIAVFAQLGDLSKSVLKRDLQIDDFGSIFGVHGGFLDRFDGLLFAMPLAYYYLHIFFVMLK